jgi:DNA polymerase-3 subunit epsilon
VVIDRGRELDEKSAIFIEDGIFKGIGYFNLNYQINNSHIIKSLITPMENNRDVQHILKNHLRKNKQIKILNF